MNGLGNQPANPSIQFRVLNCVVSIAWIVAAFFGNAHLILGYNSIEHIVFAALCFLLAMFYVGVWKFMLPKTVAARELDFIAISVFTPALGLVFARHFFFQESVGIAQVSVLMLLGALVIHSTRVFVGLLCGAVALSLAIYWVLGAPLGFEEFGHLLFVLPLACVVSRTVIDAADDIALRQNRNSFRLQTDLEQTRNMLNGLIGSKEKLEAKARDARAQLDSIVELAPIHIKVFGRDGQLLSHLGVVEPAGEAELNDRKGDQHPKFQSAFQAALDGEVTRYVVAANSKRAQKVSLRPLFDQFGNVAAVAKITFETGRLSDNTGSENRWDSRKMEGLGNLAAGIAHDFNNYLLAIVQFSEWINVKLEQSVLDHIDLQQLKQKAASIRKTAVDAARVCEEVLMYSGHSRQSKRLHDINQILVEAKPILASVVPPGTQLKFLLSEEPQWATIDESMFQRVLVNIVKNSGESFMDKSGEISIQTKSQTYEPDYFEAFHRGPDFVPSKSYCAISFTDDGAGMDQATVEKVFTPYFSKKSRGHGLGMAIAEGIVVAHNGLIRCQSEVDVGTTFEILLPKMDDVSAFGVDGSKRPVERRQKEIIPRRILVVDDEPSVRASIEWILESMGHDVIAAESGEKALEVLEANIDLDCLVLDYMMPGVNGLELLREIRGMGIETPCVLCTGCTADLDTSGSLPVPQEILAKPYEFDELQAAIDRVITAPAN